MRKIDLNKNIIFEIFWQSNGAGRGLLADKSTTGIYAQFANLEGVNIDPKVFTSENLKITEYNTNIYSDFLTNATNPYDNRTGTTPTGVNLMFSCLVKLIDHLNSLGFSKKVIILNNALGGTSIRQIHNTIDWGNPRKLAYESHNRVKQLIIDEKRKTGDDSQVISVMVGGESEISHYTTFIDNLHRLYNYKKRFFGIEPTLFAGLLMTDRTNEWFKKFQEIYPDNFSYIGQSLPDGTSIFDYLEANDPTGTLLANDLTTMSTAGDKTHWNWKAQTLQGILFFEELKEKML